MICSDIAVTFILKFLQVLRKIFLNETNRQINNPVKKYYAKMYHMPLGVQTIEFRIQWHMMHHYDVFITLSKQVVQIEILTKESV